MKIVVGLGNPEKKYADNFHNMGFMALDVLAKKLNVGFTLKPSLKCALAEGVIFGGKFVLVKPTTFMNSSGDAVRAVTEYFKAEAKDLLVIYDDLDIDIGKMRFRASGSSGTHNGMRSIIAVYGTEEFKRIRIGIKKYNENIPTIDYVLSNVPKEFAETFNKVLAAAADCAYDFICGAEGETLMQKYNGTLSNY